MDVAADKKLDNSNGNTLCQDTIKKKMKNFQVAFQFLSCEYKSLVVYKEITCHLIFDVEMDSTQKSRYVAGGYLTNPTSSMTYASVVS